MNEREELDMLRQREELEQLRALEANERPPVFNLGFGAPAWMQRPAQAASGVIEGLASLPGLPWDLARSLSQHMGSLAQTEPRLNPTNPMGYVVNKGAQLAAKGIQAGSQAIEEALPRPVNDAVSAVTRFGSDTIRNALQESGVTLPAPTDATGRILRRAGQDVGAGMLPAGLALRAARTAAPLVQGTPSMVQQVISAARNAPARFMATDVGSAVASGTGAGVAREIYPESQTVELLGSLTGAASPAGVAMGVRGLLRGGPGNAQRLRESIDTFERAGASPSVGTGTGSIFRQALETTFGRLPGGVSVMRRAAEETAEKLKQSTERIADRYGRPAAAEQTGRVIERGIREGFIPRFQKRAETLFDRIDNFIPPESMVGVVNTKNTLEHLTTPIKGAEKISAELMNPKIATIHRAFAADAKSGTLPYQALKDLRSQVGRLLSSSELISEAPKAQLKQLYAALSDDMKAAAAAAGPKALAAFNRANDYYRSGMKRIEGELESLLKKAHPEDVFKAATAGEDGASTIRTVRRSLKASEWDIVASTVLRRLGRAKPGQQDDLMGFSVESYLTNWNKLSKAGKSAIFGGTRYAGMQSDLNAIAKVAGQIRRSSRVLANTSGTAGATANISAVVAAAGGLAAGDVTVPLLVAAVSATSAGAAKLMTSPKFVRWLAGSTRLPPERIPGYIARLAVTMRDEDRDTRDAVTDYLSTIREASR